MTEPEDFDQETDVGALGPGYVELALHRIDRNDKAAPQAIEAWGLR